MLGAPGQFKQIRQMGCRSNDNQAERNQRKPFIDVGPHQLQSSQIIGNSRKQLHNHKAKAKVTNPSTMHASRNEYKIYNDKRPQFTSNESQMRQSAIGGSTKAGSQVNSKPKICFKSKQGGVAQNGSILKTTKANVHAIHGNKRAAGQASTSQHSQEPRKENVSMNANRIAEYCGLRSHNGSSSIPPNQQKQQPNTNIRSI